MPPVRMVLDTDIGGDADDAMALALCLRHPDIDLRAVTTVSGDAVGRARIAAKLLQLAGRDDIEVSAGVSDDPERENGGAVILEDGDESGLTLSSRDAVTLLTAEAAAAPGELTIATIGSQSNVAAALDADPTFAGNVGRLAVMGGVFAPMQVGGRPIDADADYNLNVDPAGSVRSLNGGMPALYVPCDVTFGTALRTPHLERLRQGDE